MKKLVVVVVVLALMLLGAFATGPFLTLHALRGAIDRQDASALSEHVDFPAVRSSLHAQVADYIARRTGAHAQDGLLGALGVGMASAVSGTAADLLATPAGIAAVMQGRSVFNRISREGLRTDAVTAAPARNPLDGATWRFETASRFVVTVPNADDAPVVFVLTREGFDWDVTDVRVPLHALDPTL